MIVIKKLQVLNSSQPVFFSRVCVTIFSDADLLGFVNIAQREVVTQYGKNTGVLDVYRNTFKKNFKTDNACSGDRACVSADIFRR